MSGARVVALTGGTGFTGRRVAARLAMGDTDLRCLVRPTSDTSVLPDGATTVVGDLEDRATLDDLLCGASALVYTASMGFGHIPDVVAAARAAGVERAVFVSTTGIFTKLNPASKAVRLAAEECVRGSGLTWTIVRPTMIYGAPGDRNIERLLRALCRWPALPIPGSGQSLIQPVHVEDLADGIVAALDSPDAANEAFDLSGAEPLAFRDAVDAAYRALRPTGRSRARRVHLPLWPVLSCLRVTEAIGLRLPIKSEQVLRLAEDKAFPHDAASEAFGYAPRGFEEGVAAEAAALALVRP